MSDTSVRNVPAGERTRSRACVVVAIAVILAAVVLPLTSGCIGKADPLLGKWHFADGSTMEFLKDGTAMAGGLIPMTGNYSYPAQGRVRINWGGLGALVGPQVYDYDISGDTLVMTDQVGVTWTCTRLR